MPYYICLSLGTPSNNISYWFGALTIAALFVGLCISYIAEYFWKIIGGLVVIFVLLCSVIEILIHLDNDLYNIESQSWIGFFHANRLGYAYSALLDYTCLNFQSLLLYITALWQAIKMLNLNWLKFICKVKMMSMLNLLKNGHSKAAQLGHVEAMYWLGEGYAVYAKDMLEEDPEESKTYFEHAHRWLEQAAKHDHPAAILELANFYRRGDVVKRC